jgi:hypothetical protein
MESSPSTVDLVSGSSTGARSYDIPKRLLEPIGRMLRTGDAAATIDRLFVSEHVKDLRLIIAFALIAVLVVLVSGLLGSLAYAWEFHDKYSSSQVVISALRGFVAFFAPALGIFGAVLAWAYQVGSARLGIVDLFACEVDTLCRVALVVDSVPRSIVMFHKGSPGPQVAGGSAPTTRHFTSEENYFPVFENNIRDLQALEARVVVNITAFYTYMKAVRDSSRTLIDISASSVLPGPPRPDKASNLTGWEDAARNVIYMMFLGLESARKAIGYLVEFEPERVERTIVILISELEAYRFLREQFVDEEDIRHRRLDLREADYRRLVPSLCSDVETSRGSKPLEWEPARRLVPELNRKYDAVITQKPLSRRLASAV